MVNRARDGDGTAKERRERRYDVITFFIVLAAAATVDVLAMSLLSGADSLGSKPGGPVAVPLAVGAVTMLVGVAVQTWAGLTERPAASKRRHRAAAAALGLTGAGAAALGAVAYIHWG